MAEKNPYGTMDVQLTAVAVGYRNRQSVGAEVAPPTPAEGETFKYQVSNKTDFFTVPETLVGRTGEVNEVEFSSGLLPGATEDHGLVTKIARKDIALQQNLGVNLMAAATEKLTNTMILRKEVEIATLVQNPAVYATNNKWIYGGTDGWDKIASDPIREIRKAIREGIVAYNRLGLSDLVWDYLSTHQKVIQYCFGPLATAGAVGADVLAAKLGLDKIVIGQMRVNTALPGETPVIANTWTNNAFLYRFDVPVSTRQAESFAIDANWAPFGSSRITYQKNLEPGDFGIEGGVQIVVGEHSKTLITAPDYAHLFGNVVSLDS